MIQLSLRTNVFSDRLVLEYQVANGTNAPVYLADDECTGVHPSAVPERPTAASTWLLSSGELLILEGFRLTPLMPPDLENLVPHTWPAPSLSRVEAGGTRGGVVALRLPIAASYGNPGKPFDTVLTKRFRFALDVLTPPPGVQPREVDGSSAVRLDWLTTPQTRLKFAGELPHAVAVESTTARWNTQDGDRHAEMIEANRTHAEQSSGAHLPIWRY